MIMEKCEQLGLFCAYTSKLFFNQFTTSLTINFPESLRSEYDEACKAVRHTYGKVTSGAAYQEMLTDLRAANTVYNVARNNFIAQFFAGHGKALPDATEFRMNKVSVTFYLDDPTGLVPVIDAYRDSIVKVVIPRNEEEIALLRANTNKIIQDRYYFDQYPYRITFKSANSHDYLNRYVHEQFCDLRDGKQCMDQTRGHYYSTSQPVLYLADLCDLILTQIGVQELIQKTEEIILRD